MEAKGKHGEGWENRTQMTRMKRMYADFFLSSAQIRIICVILVPSLGRGCTSFSLGRGCTSFLIFRQVST